MVSLESPCSALHKYNSNGIKNFKIGQFCAELHRKRLTTTHHTHALNPPGSFYIYYWIITKHYGILKISVFSVSKTVARPVLDAVQVISYDYAYCSLYDSR